ncbi:MAG: M20 family metallopeptidase [Planctomycetaceae bacterium]|nr:M20 family metallopeptidase [Planctomycetaceae bacterium]
MTNNEDLKSRLIALTRDLTMIPSTESRPQERKRCFELLHHHIDQLPSIQIDYYDCNEHRSMVVRPQGVEAPEILLCGHLDVIEHSQPNCYHSKIEQGRIYGPGSGDMKGQIAILIELLRTLHTQQPGISLGLALTSDEERGGADGIRYLCEDVGLRCGTAIIPDGGSLNDVTTEEKGVIHVRVSHLGHESHGARPWLGKNALEMLIERLMLLKKHFYQWWPTQPVEEQINHWFSTCCITMCNTENTTPNRIPDQASAILDIRFIPPHSVNSMLAEITTILGPDCIVNPLMTAEPTNLEPDPLFCEVTTNITNQPVKLVKASGGSDGRFFRQYGIPVNLSRPLVGNLHAIDEWIDINSMITYYEICEAYIKQKLER